MMKLQMGKIGALSALVLSLNALWLVPNASYADYAAAMQADNFNPTTEQQGPANTADNLAPSAQPGVTGLSPASSMTLIDVWNKWGPTGSYWEGKSWRPVVSFGEGGALPTKVGESKNFPATDEIFSSYDYSQTGSTSISLLSDVFVGVEMNVAPQWALQLGVDYNQPLSFTSNGNLTQGIEIDTQKYGYSYNVVVQQLMGQGKLLYTVADRYHPYLTAGLGVSFNKLSNFTTDTSNAVLTRSYQDNTTDSFSYMVGAGVDVDIIDHLRLGLGYRFTDFGGANFGNANIDNIPVSGTLTQSNLYANEFLAQLTWLF